MVNFRVRKIFALLGTVTLIGSISPATAQTTPVSINTTVQVDGKSSETAAASCFEIKQNDPSSKSGTYWLYTPAMPAPAQFYCDQETNGGGWVMIGRGREDWTEQYAGKGNAQDLYNNPDGTDAFSTVQLPSTTIDQLLNDQSISDQSNGMMVKRAMDKAGSTTQAVTFKTQNRQDWSWKFSYYARYDNFVFSQSNKPGTSITKGLSQDMIRRDDANPTLAVSFYGRSVLNWKMGFGYGPNVLGSKAADSYLWTPTEGGQYALPFAQAFVKPTLTQADLKFDDVSDTGTAEKTNRALPNSLSEKVSWRTSDETGTGIVHQDNTYVQSFTQSGNTVFAGGDFKYLENAQTGEKVEQKFLAGFDVNSGELTRSFAPTFNNQVKTVEALPNGKLAVGGQFTTVNGKPHAGFVVLDPTTGTIDEELSTTLENLTSAGVVKVSDLLVKDNYLYIGGLFTHLTDVGSSHSIFSRNAARIDLTTGKIDAEWRPDFNGTVNGLSVAPDSSAVYAAGYFSTLHGEEAIRLAAIDPTNGKRLAPWKWDSSYPARVGKVANYDYQYAVQAIEGAVWTAGSEHIISKYNANGFARQYSAITRNGGDFQSFSFNNNNNVLYASCHCGDAVYEGASSFQSPYGESSLTNIHQIRLLGAWDPTTGKYLPQFNPQLSGKSGNGVWASFTDSTGVLWAGGDINRSMGVGGYAQATVGFARFAPNDSAAPSTPNNLTAETKDGKDQLNWSSSPDGDVTYQIIRNNKVIASTTDTTFAVTHQDGARYFVRATDAAGNISASTPVVQATVAPVTVSPKTVLSSGDTWNYKLGTNAPDSDWNKPGANATSWSTGKTAMGWSNSTLATAIDRGTDRPLSFYARKTVTLDSLEEYKKLYLNTYADDGIVVYVNGQEVARQGMPDGAVNYQTWAKSSQTTSAAKNTPLEIDVPLNSLKTGENTIAVEVHAGYRSSPNVTFDMTGELR
ncbi:fibrinogen-like YCDxxxxGGGW domain-containing protein [uncultured Rothia sp.]|uniref:fibrinogen-like YCDxxxxGGGW domain-containing protein n=1 Tax=uncultured Rothia sp. TaxID=316088 RepID=UPI003216F9A4